MFILFIEEHNAFVKNYVTYCVNYDLFIIIIPTELMRNIKKVFHICCQAIEVNDICHIKFLLFFRHITTDSTIFHIACINHAY